MLKSSAIIFRNFLRFLFVFFIVEHPRLNIFKIKYDDHGHRGDEEEGDKDEDNDADGKYEDAYSTGNISPTVSYSALAIV